MSKFCKPTRAIAAAALGAAILLPLASAAKADPSVEVGVLSCTVEGGAGFIVGSTKNLVCQFERPGADETYTGTIRKFGLDVGVTGKTVIVWAVFAPSKDIPSGALEGSYAGVSAEASVGAGLGANALLGGSDKSFALQPLSVQAQTGLNLAVGISSLSLKAAN